MNRLEVIREAATKDKGAEFSSSEMLEVFAEIDRLREALLLARRWTMGNGFSGEVCVQLKTWIDNGMSGPLPEFHPLYR